MDRYQEYLKSKAADCPEEGVSSKDVAANELVLEFPLEVVKLCGGLGLDVGSSASKFVYLSSEDAKMITEAKPGSQCKLRLTTCSNNYLQDNMSTIKSWVHILRAEPDQPVVIMGTGVGGHHMHGLFSKAFNVQMVQMSEFDCAPVGFMLLAQTQTQKTLLFPFVKGATALPTQHISIYRDLNCTMLHKGQTKVQMPGETLMDEVPTWPDEILPDTIDNTVPLAAKDVYPCLLITLGSGNCYYRINADGTYQVTDASQRGGRYFLTLGSILCGTSDFNELIDLAEKGDNRNTDTFFMDITDRSINDLYGLGGDVEFMAFNLGKLLLAGKDTLKKEDLARGLLVCIIMDTVQCVQLSAISQGVKKVYFSGSFINRYLVRYLITAEFTRRNLCYTLWNGKKSDVEYYFMRHGPFLTALGCLATNIHMAKEKLKADQK